MMKYALVLAAGKGTRMRTELPKCAYPILKKPMISYLVENLEQSVVDETCVVVGHKKEVLQDILQDRVLYAHQTEQLGTAHAVLAAEPALGDKEGMTLILPGDMPLMEYPAMNQIFAAHEEMGNDLTIVSMRTDHPKGYGRILRNHFGQVIGIIEENDCNETQKLIDEVNSSVYVIDNKHLFEVVKKISLNERKGEYYLTDMVALMAHDYKVNTVEIEDPVVTMGVNDLYGISIAEKYLRDAINKSHMLNGVSMVNPETITIAHNAIIEPGVLIYPNSVILGNSVIKAGAIIGPNTEINDSIIRERAEVRHSIVKDSEVGAETTVGPFAHMRAHAVVGERNRIGNFVEVKNSEIGNDTKASHLIYIGDADVGSHVNFGCGSVTVNYDGVTKHRTVIGDDVFIGCNVNLVAPIKVHDNVFIAAGSTVTQDIPKGAFAIARNRQINKEDYAKNYIRGGHPIKK